jgi:hypothetical protein
MIIAAALIATALPRCATTSDCPRIVQYAAPWSLAAKPSEIVLGASRPILGITRWTRYNHSDAVATGWGESELPGCTQPSYLCPFGKRPATITFTRPVKGGAGKWYFSRMHVAGNVGIFGIKPNWGITKAGLWG